MTNPALARFRSILDEAAAWDESKYERDASGRFAPKGEGSSGEMRTSVMGARAPRAGAKTSRGRNAASAKEPPLFSDPTPAHLRTDAAFGAPVERDGTIAPLLSVLEKSTNRQIARAISSSNEVRTAGYSPEEQAVEQKSADAYVQAVRDVHNRFVDALAAKFENGMPSEDDFNTFHDQFKRELKDESLKSGLSAEEKKKRSDEYDAFVDADLVDTMRGDVQFPKLDVSSQKARAFRGETTGAYRPGESDEDVDTTFSSYVSDDKQYLPSALRNDGWDVRVDVGSQYGRVDGKPERLTTYGSKYEPKYATDDGNTFVGMTADKTHADGSRTEIEASAVHVSKDVAREYRKGMRFKWTNYDKDGLMRETGFENTLADAVKQSRPKRSLGESALNRFRELTESGEWDESKYERDASGRFAPKGEGGASSDTDKTYRIGNSKMTISASELERSAMMDRGMALRRAANSDSSVGKIAKARKALRSKIETMPGLKFENEFDSLGVPGATRLGTVSYGDTRISVTAFSRPSGMEYHATISREVPEDRPETEVGPTPWAAVKAVGERYGNLKQYLSASSKRDAGSTSSDYGASGYKAGDIVRLTGEHMRSTGRVSGPVDGKIVGASDGGSLGTILDVDWSDGNRSKINSGSVEYANRDLRDLAKERRRKTLGEAALERFAAIDEACCAACAKGDACEGEAESPCAKKKKKLLRTGLPPEPAEGAMASVMESFRDEAAEGEPAEDEPAAEKEPLVDTPAEDDDQAVNQAAAEESEPEAKDKDDYRERVLRRSRMLAKLRDRRDPDGIEREEPQPALDGAMQK